MPQPATLTTTPRVNIAISVQGQTMFTPACNLRELDIFLLLRILCLVFFVIIFALFLLGLHYQFFWFLTFVVLIIYFALTKGPSLSEAP